MLAYLKSSASSSSLAIFPLLTTVWYLGRAVLAVAADAVRWLLQDSFGSYRLSSARWLPSNRAF